MLQGIEAVQGLWLKAHGSSLVPQMLLLQWIGNVQVIEQRNKAMNQFIADLVAKMREADIYAILVKGQGVAQCYEKPLWRPSGDIDLLLSEENYTKAKDFMLPMSSSHKREGQYSKQWVMSIGQWYVEIHGSLRSGLSAGVDKEIDAVQNDVFYGGNVRSTEFMSSSGSGVQVFLPAPNEDVFLVFTHFIKHFYKEGMSLRQVCDWCRLLWTYRDSLNHGKLESWIKKAGLMDEWRAFAALAVEYLGLSKEAIPLYSADSCWRRKAEKILAFILKGGEWHKWRDTMSVARIFPVSTLRFAPGILLNVNWLKIKVRVLG